MAQNTKKVKDIMDGMQTVKADDPDLLEKLNLIALQVAEAQGKISASKSKNNNFNNIDPMEDLGCEGCQ